MEAIIAIVLAQIIIDSGKLSKENIKPMLMITNSTKSIIRSVNAVATAKLKLIFPSFPTTALRIISPALAGKRLFPKYPTLLAQKNTYQ